MHFRLLLILLCLLNVFAQGQNSPVAKAKKLNPEISLPRYESHLTAGFLGLSVRNNRKVEGIVIGAILPGPMDGKFWTSPYCERGDVLLEVDGKKVPDKKTFTKIMSGRKPGEIVTLKIRRSDPKRFTDVPEPGNGQKIDIVKVELARASDWAGPMMIKKNNDTVTSQNHTFEVLTSPTLVESFTQKYIDELKLTSPVARLRNFLWDEKISQIYPRNFSDKAAYAFHHPARLLDLEKKAVTPLKKLQKNPLIAIEEATKNLELKWTSPKVKAISLEPKAAMDWFEKVGNQSNNYLKQAFKDFDSQQLKYLSSESEIFLDKINSGTGIMRQEEPERSIAVLQASTRVNYQALSDAFSALSPIILTPKSARFNMNLKDPPEELKTAIKGKIFDSRKTENGWIVYGGMENNNYDMNLISFVIDPGGDDHYNIPKASYGKVQAIIDLAGSDVYKGEKQGPACGWLGISYIVDFRGNDHYEGESQSCGAGFFGAGVLVDYQGTDFYSGDFWSCGSGLYGVGILLDLGNEADVYQSALYSQGVGSAKGFGLLYDSAGNDLYRSNGPAKSAYNTPAVFSTYGQGAGIGIRGYDVGGIGMLIDENGNDRYEGGEFSQGIGYSWGLGILHDTNGNDLYYGNRYSQGVGCHQALGILVDENGNDLYWSMTTASKGMAWDLGVGMLLDKKGDDVYYGESLSMGSASQQSFAWFFDLSGNDFYQSRGAAIGMSGYNSYHWEDSECHSLSFFLDAGGGNDFYGNRKSNNTVKQTNRVRKEKPEDWYYYGIFIDQEATFELD